MQEQRGAEKASEDVSEDVSEEGAAPEGAEITLTLFAPHNEAAEVVADFTDWKPAPMEKGEDGTFRRAFTLADGVYRYKFKIRTKSWFFEDGAWVDIVDPYATEVEDSAEQNGILRVIGGARRLDSYTWAHDDVPLPPDAALVIYEMHIGDFSGGEGDSAGAGTYRAALEKLDHLEGLGVNAVELMPTKEFPGEESWGYNPRYLFAAESAYGSTEDLKAFVDACHGRGIRVLMDGIFNHAETETPLAHIDHDYWFHHSPKDEAFSYGPQYNYDHYDEALKVHPARRFIGHAIRFWVREYHIDGIRFDATRQIDNFEALRGMVRAAKDQAGPKPFYCVAEHIAEDPAVTGPEGPMDGAWHESFCHTLGEALSSGRADLGALMARIGGKDDGYPGLVNAVNYLANHDHERITRRLAEAGHDEDAQIARHRLGAAILLTSVGVPLIWMGQELGEMSPKTQRSTPLRWSLMEDPRRQGLLDTYRRLIPLRTHHPALRGEGLKLLHQDGAAGVLAYARTTEGPDVLVIVSFNPEALPGYAIPAIPPGRPFRDALSDGELQASEAGLILDLPPLAALVLVDAGWTP